MSVIYLVVCNQMVKTDISFINLTKTFHCWSVR